MKLQTFRQRSLIESDLLQLIEDFRFVDSNGSTLLTEMQVRDRARLMIMILIGIGGDKKSMIEWRAYSLW